MTEIKKNPTVALLGQPNSGKSTLFNALTGSRQHVGNWPGKTVEKKEGFYAYKDHKVKVIDLPGTYSLSANSDEEVITRDYIASGKADVVCVLADASQLERSLFMLADYAGMNCSTILLLNLMDVAQGQGKKIDTKKIEHKLGIPVIPFVAADRSGYQPYHEAIEQALEKKCVVNTEYLTASYQADTDGVFDAILQFMPEQGIEEYSPMWLAAKMLEGDKLVQESVKHVVNCAAWNKVEQILAKEPNGALKTGGCKFAWIDRILEGAVTGKKRSPGLSKFDQIATSRRWGKLLALGMILLGLVLSFIPATPIMMIGSGLSVVGQAAKEMMLTAGVPGIITTLICDLLLGSLTFAISMVGFVVGISLVFGLMEEIGYMARISYVFDHTMSKLGLQGKSVMPFLVSLGCTIGGASSTRVIDSWGQRVLTIAMAWAVPCAATWEIVPLLATVFFGAWAPLIVVILFVTALLVMFIVAKVFGRKLVPNEEKTGMIMELPPYHKPKWKNLFYSVAIRAREILVKAFRIIFLVALVFWVLTYSADGSIEGSVIYKVGMVIEPVTRFFGMGWQTFMAFLCAIVAKEAALGVLSSVFTGGSSLVTSTMGFGVVSSSLGGALASAITGPEALAFIFGVTFNVPCLVTLATTYGETRSLKWTVRMAVFYLLMALALSFVVFHISSLIM